jgi:hypothetical protein
VGKHSFLVIFPKMGNQLRVRVRPEAMTAGFEFCSALAIVEEFAVEDYGYRAGFVLDGLLAVGEPHDTQTAIGEAEAWTLEKAIFIRTTMNNGGRHSGKCPRGDRAILAAQIDNACDAAHSMSPFMNRRAKSRPFAARKTTLFLQT